MSLMASSPVPWAVSNPCRPPENRSTGWRRPWHPAGVGGGSADSGSRPPATAPAAAQQDETAGTDHDQAHRLGNDENLAEVAAAAAGAHAHTSTPPDGKTSARARVTPTRGQEARERHPVAVQEDATPTTAAEAILAGERTHTVGEDHAADGDVADGAELDRAAATTAGIAGSRPAARSAATASLELEQEVPVSAA